MFSSDVILLVLVVSCIFNLGISGLIFLESDNESDGFLGSELRKANGASFASHAVKDFGHGINFVDSADSRGK